MIIANHAHLIPEGSEPCGTVDELLKCMDYNNIDICVVFPPFACQFKNNSMKGANLWGLEQTRKHPDRLIPSGTINPISSDAIKLLHILKAEGVSWIKIHPSIDIHDIASAEITDFYAEAEKLNMILDYHTGPHFTRLSLCLPEKFDAIAWDFPRLKLIFEHMGGRTYFEEFLAIINNHKPNDSKMSSRVFGGLTSVFDDDINIMWHLGQKKILDVIRISGADKLIFGLDFPWNSNERIGKDIEIIKSLDISEDDRANILGGNLMQLLKSVNS